ncbi:MAG: tetratricopeptide repeat protein [Saprospiraceae bacterium]|jgi:tetratricopeptide (TPR) repeat protein|nr:tetratricopeptide repeat protein [Saprospiraceae bacterium]
MKTIYALLLFFLPCFSFAQTMSLDKGTTRAVVVGISDYQNEKIPDLRFADKDAQVYSEFLQSPAGGGLEAEQIKTLLNEQATNAQIAAALEWLIEVSQEGDQAIIYFSGHGDVETKTMFQLGFLLGWDSPAQTYAIGAFPLNYLQAIVSTLSLQNKAEVTLITDACRAGKLAGSSVGGAQITNSNLSKQFANEAKILSCQPDEFSLEGEQWGGGRGVFSYHLVDGLYGLADNNSDLTVNLFEIGRYLEDKVSNEASPHSQFPMVIGSKTTAISRVDEAALALLKEEKSKESPTLATVESKGFEDMILADLDSTWQQKYRAFTVAVAEGYLLEAPTGKPVAYDLYLELVKATELQRLHGTMKRNLAAAFQDDAQQTINAYLEANPTELSKRYAAETDYDRYPKYLRKAAEILGEQNFYYPYVMAKLYYFEGLQMRLEADNNIEKSSYQEAIDKQQKALEYQEYAPYVLNELGVLHTRLKASEEAVGYYEKSIEMAPEWGLPYVNLCLEYYYSNNQEKAIETGNKAIELMPDYPQLYNLLAWVYGNFRGEYRDKRTWTRKGVELKDDFLFDTDNISTLAQKKSKFEQSIILLKKAVEIDSNFASAHANLGDVYSQINLVEPAIYHLKKSVQIDSTKELTYAFLGDALTINSEYEEAEKAYLRAIQLSEKSGSNRKSLWLNSLGITYYSWGKDDEALKVYKEAIELSPSYDYPYSNLAHIYLDKGDYEKSEWYRLLVRGIRPTYPGGYSSLGYVYSKMDRFEEAEHFYLKAIELLPSFRHAISGLINNVYIINGQFEKAAEWQEKLLEMAPNDPSALYGLARSAYLSKEYDKAELNFQKAVQLDSTNIDRLNNIGYFYRFHSEFEKAKHYLIKAHQSKPKNRYPYTNLGIIHFDEGLKEEGIAWLDTALVKFQDPMAFYFKMVLHLHEENYQEAHVQLDSLLGYDKKNKIFSDFLKALEEEDYHRVDSLIQAVPDTLNGLPGYFQARVEVKLDRLEKAFETLKSDGQLFPYRMIIQDPFLKPLHQLPAFQKWLRLTFPEKYDDLDEFEFKHLDHHPKYYSENCIILGNYYESEGMQEQADALFRKAIEVQPDSLTDELAINLAAAYIGLGEIEQAKAICPDSVQTTIREKILMYGGLYYLLSRPKKAEKYFQKFYQANPTPSSAYQIGHFYIMHGEKELAEKYQSMALEQDTISFQGYQYFAWLYFTFGEAEEAIKYLDLGIEKFPNSIDLKIRKAMIVALSISSQKPSDAIKELLTIRSDMAEIAQCLDLMKAKKYEEATLAYEKIQKDFSDWFVKQSIRVAYARMLVEKGDLDGAMNTISEAPFSVFNYQLLHNDRALAPLKETERFKKHMLKNFPEKLKNTTTK